MTDTDSERPILGIDASADGRRNAYSSRCGVVEQVMNYAACQWRQGVLGQSDIRTPADWSACAQARSFGTCPALRMREEEVLAGKAIYFVERARGGDNPVVSPARAWIDTAWKGAKKALARVTPSAAPAPARSALDALGEVGSYSDALNALASEHASAPTPAVASRPAQPPIPMLEGESPLAYAKRVREAAAHS